MITVENFRKMALAFPDTVEEPHFESTSFKVKKKIFATLSVEKMQACLKLSLYDQEIYCAMDKSIIFPVDNYWGSHGWTFVNIKKVKKEILSTAMTSAYNEILSSKSKKKVKKSK
ncbi:MAG: MmcQ/YjbR family DNA-binding protein [Leptospiraceae bacterium]|nr:MmcQ/YjbR family DNA-binding protein [Leptospiraceae bacterium]